jgi:RNA 3'-phosphate cyclase
MSKSILEIDGSQGEGGGQVLRTSLALSLITGKAFHLRKIRAGRSKPGLQAQHLMSVQAAAKIGAAKVRGASLGSVNLTFEPGEVTPGAYHFKIGTAGATSLVLQTIYLPLALAGGESTVTIEGGTHVKASPCYHFLERCWARYLQSLGITVELKLERVGFYPRGGGMIRARVESVSSLRAFSGMTSDSIARATILALVAGLPTHVGERMIQKATSRLRDLGLEVESRQETWSGGPGCMLGIELPTDPAPTFFFALGERGKPAEAVANEAAGQVSSYLAPKPLGVDEHSADQLLLPLALAEGPSEFRVSAISSHLITNAAVIQEFLDRSIECDGTPSEPGFVRIS